MKNKKSAVSLKQLYKIREEKSNRNRNEIINIKKGVCDILMWRGNTTSGIDIEGYLDPDVTVYPKIR